MPIRRRTLLTVAGVFCGAAALAPSIACAETDPRMAERAIGSADAKGRATEFFSLTCGHCAAFARDTLPQIKKTFVETGRLRLTYVDFPLDQLALTAAMVARSLPPDRYDAFVGSLLASQDRWAFARGVDNTQEIYKTAALAGMSRAAFDAAIADNALKAFILKQQEDAVKRYNVDSTPTFIINGQKRPGALSYEAFAKALDAPPA